MEAAPHPAYRIEGPALISFSGGRTSAYMLHEILRAHDGALPADVHVCFANTGKEREETLRFVHECGSRWGVPIRWIEWRDTESGFDEVGYNSASRSGQPFSALIAKRGFVPNSVSRFCSVTLKVRAMRNFVRAELGWKRWNNAIGLRYDEGHRVLKALARNETGKDSFRAIMPMSKAKATVRTVAAFWERQDFDLGIRSHEGNCDLCFLKSKPKLKSLMRDHPEMAGWWIDQERAVAETATGLGATFRIGDSYADLMQSVLSQPDFLDALDDGEHDAECGHYCGEAS